MNNANLVNIICLTYNFEKFINKCLDGFVMQITNFKFEIIVHDDASNDKTVEIIRSYEIKYPGLFRNIYQTEKQYNKENTNILIDFIFPNCQGKYIALCDGDDYWTDPNKLQKQVDFLEKNEGFNLCYHDVLILSNNKILDKDFINKTNKKITTKYDLAVWGNYIHTCSVVIRNNIDVIKNFNTDINFCDYLFYLYFVNDSKIFKIDETMSVYRYGNGIWASSSNKDKYKFAVDNIHNILKITGDDTIKEIMNLRLNTIALYSLPKYVTILENIENRTYKFELNERIPFSVLINIFFKKINFLFKKNKVERIK